MSYSKDVCYVVRLKMLVYLWDILKVWMMLLKMCIKRF